MLIAFASLSHLHARLFRLGGGALLVALFVGVIGCGGANETANSVSGKVMLGSDPVNGELVFIGSDGKELPTPIMVGGNYKLDNPPMGQVKVLVRSMAGTTGGGLAIKDAPKVSTATGGVAPPAKYSNAKTSDITYEVKPGKHKHDFTLTP